MATGFCRLAIRIEDRVTLDVMEELVNDIRPQVGSIVYHWASPVRAHAWWAFARALLNDNARIQALNAPINTTNKNANRAQSVAQYTFVLSVMQAIANGYNCLNLVWHNDPLARALYRKWIAGPPTMPGQEHAIFDEAENYNSAWYLGGNVYPLLREGASTLQTAAMPMHGRGGKPKDSFAISAMLGLASASEVPWKPEIPIDYAPKVFNVPIVRMAFMASCPAEQAWPWSKQCTVDSRRTGLYPGRLGTHRPTGQNFEVIRPNGMPGASEPLQDDFDDWRCTYKGLSYAGHIVTAPLVDYLPYLQEWAKLLLTRTAAQTIQDTRQYTVYENERTIRLNGGPGIALPKALGSAGDIAKQQRTPDAGWQSAAAGVTALGAAIATVPGGYTQAAGLVLGAVGATISVADSLSTHGVQGHGRDDLGRYKLVLERGWLAGDPASEDEGAGAAVFPPQQAAWILQPPGTWTDAPCAPAPTSTDAGKDAGKGTAPQQPSPKPRNWTPWIVGGVLLVVGGLALSEGRQREKEVE
jgi:hypothetical protein